MSTGNELTVRRNYLLASEKHDAFFDWIQELLNHSFVLNMQSTYCDTFSFVEEIINEHRVKPIGSRLRKVLPLFGAFFTPLPLRAAFELYDEKYSISQRRFIRPSFNEIRHIVNLAQVMAIGKKLKFISFDGDQTLYTDGGNFDATNPLTCALKDLLIAGVHVAVVTAAGYGLNTSKYEVRVGSFLNYLKDSGLTKEQVERLYVCGGECNYLMRCTYEDTLSTDGTTCTMAKLTPVYPEEWQSPRLNGPKPSQWRDKDIKELLDVAENVMKEAISELKLRVSFIRKERAIGMYPGGEEKIKDFPVGHGSIKVKKEALDEVVFRIKEALSNYPTMFPYCVFNGGRDVWVDIGNKSVGVAALQAYFGVSADQSLYVGDQFLNTGNDIAARMVAPCIWINSPSETGKILQHVLKHADIPSTATGMKHTTTPATAAGGSGTGSGTVFNAFSGEHTPAV